MIFVNYFTAKVLQLGSIVSAMEIANLEESFSQKLWKYSICILVFLLGEFLEHSAIEE